MGQKMLVLNGNSKVWEWTTFLGLPKWFQKISSISKSMHLPTWFWFRSDWTSPMHSARPSKMVLYSCSAVSSWPHIHICKHFVQRSLNAFQHAVRNRYSQYGQEPRPIASSKIHNCHYQDATPSSPRPSSLLEVACTSTWKNTSEEGQ